MKALRGDPLPEEKAVDIVFSIHEPQSMYILTVLAFYLL
jgi:hypothetical protein